MSTVLEAYRASQAAGSTAGSGGNSYFLKKDQRLLREFQPGRSGVMNEKWRFLVNPNQVAPGQNPYFTEYYGHEFSGNGRKYMVPCPKKNNGEPCASCDREEAMKKQGFDRRKAVKEQFGEEAMKNDAEAKATLKQANYYSARKFYVVRGINRANQNVGARFWFIKENHKKQGIWDQLEPMIKQMVDSGIDISDPQQGRDLNLTISQLPKFDNSGFYNGVTSMSFDPVPTALASTQEEVNRLVNDPIEWQQLREPVGVRGWLTPGQFIEEAINGRMPYWDVNVKVGDFSGAWIITPPNGVAFVATYENSPEKRNQAAKAITESDLQATHLGVNPTQAPAAQPAYQAPAAQQPVYTPAPTPQQPVYAPAPQPPVYQAPAAAPQPPVYAPAPQQQQYAAQPPAYAPAPTQQPVGYAANPAQPPVYTPTPAPMPAAAAAAYQAPAPTPPVSGNFSYNNADDDDLPF